MSQPSNPLLKIAVIANARGLREAQEHADLLSSMFPSAAVTLVDVSQGRKAHCISHLHAEQALIRMRGITELHSLNLELETIPLEAGFGVSLKIHQDFKVSDAEGLMEVLEAAASVPVRFEMIEGGGTPAAGFVIKQ